MSPPLTPKQQRVLSVFVELTQAYGREPSHGELARHLGYPSKNSIRQYYRTLKRKGYLGVAPYRWRGAFVKLPVVGRVACGGPLLAEENIEAHLPVDSRLLGATPNPFFLLIARGDSMNLAGIDEGDVLLVEGRPTAEAGEIVVALLEDEATVKRFRMSEGYITLLPQSDNPAHRPIIAGDAFQVQGVVRRVFKGKDLVL